MQLIAPRGQVLKVALERAHQIQQVTGHGLYLDVIPARTLGTIDALDRAFNALGQRGEHPAIQHLQALGHRMRGLFQPQLIGRQGATDDLFQGFVQFFQRVLNGHLDGSKQGVVVNCHEASS